MTEKKYFMDEHSYAKEYQASIDEPESFWHSQAQHYLDWIKPWHTLMQGDFHAPPIKWFIGGEINICYNAIDRHLPSKAQELALIWEGNELFETQRVTYQSLHEHVCRLANLFKSLNIEPGDVICIYMPSIPEAIYAMLACARIGAIHNVIFGGFSKESLQQRLQDSKAKLIVTVNAAKRGNKTIDFKTTVDESLKDNPLVKHVVVVKHLPLECPMQQGRDLDYHEYIQQMSLDCLVTPVEANHPLFILYTSGSTGKPKGILHRSGGYALHAALTYDYLFNHPHPHRHWCTADIGWITGHTYMVYGPLLHGVTTVIYEGIPNYPDHSRYWQMIDQHQINNFYTAPTVIRSLRQAGNSWITPFKLDSLKILGSVGEPLNPEIYHWFKETIGKNNCPVLNTWWQTETGGALLSNFPGFNHEVPGSVGKPFFGICPSIDEEGFLYIQKPWPGLMLDIHQNTARFLKDYLAQPHLGYLAGDAARVDEDGHYHINGRIDDVMNVSGHRIGSGELENTLITYPLIAESAVIGMPHDLKGEAITAFVVPFDAKEINEKTENDIKHHLRQTIGSFAVPEQFIWVKRLPKTRSGKIMRRLLKKIALDKLDELGDLSTLAEPQVIEEIIASVRQYAKA